MYQQITDPMTGGIANCIRRLPDGAIIPFDERNRDYREYLDWLKEGNIPLSHLSASTAL